MENISKEGDPVYVIDFGVPIDSISEPAKLNLGHGSSVLSFEVDFGGEVEWDGLVAKLSYFDGEGLDGEIEVTDEGRADLNFYVDSSREIAVALLPDSVVISTHYPLYPETTETAFDSQYSMLFPGNPGAGILAEHAMEAWVVPLFKGLWSDLMYWANKGEDFKKGRKIFGTALHPLYMWGTLYKGIFCGTVKGMTVGTYEMAKNAKSCFETGIERTETGEDEKAAYAYFDGAMNAGLVIFNIYATASLLNGTLTPVARRVGSKILTSAKGGFDIGPFYPGGLVPELAGTGTVAGVMTATGVAVFDYRQVFFAGLRKGSAQMLLAGGAAKGVTGSFSKPKFTKLRKLSEEELLNLRIKNVTKNYKKCARLASENCRLPLRERVEAMRRIVDNFRGSGLHKTGNPFYNVYCKAVRMKIRLEVKLLEQDIGVAVTRDELKRLIMRSKALEQNLKYLHKADADYYSLLIKQLKALAQINLENIPKAFDAF